ncbi:MAG TPA: methylated-DNA--[protein]-cysteine S-methyltransferase [Methylomirabilota bacterium]
MDRTDDVLRELFAVAAPSTLPVRVRAVVRTPAPTLEALADRFHFEATDRGIARLAFGRGRDVAAGRGRGHVEQARAELTEYLAGRRTFFTVPVDLAGVAGFQDRVLAEAQRIPFGEVSSYATLARRVGHPRAARAVGNALGANPVPVLVPCHRVIRGDGTWGHYAFGAGMKTRLLALERATPLLVGDTSTRIVCRRGCRTEQRIGEDRRVVFAAVRDAEEVGYRRCRVCRPRDTTT